MKAKASSSSSGGGDGMNGSITERVALRSASEKEKTKMRERQRRAITTKIFTGLRKHGGYNLPPRSDINDVLRQLAREAGWFIEPDGTTYRVQNHHQQLSAANPHFNTTTTTTITTPTSSSLSQQQQQYYYYCSTTSGTPTPTSSFGGGSGECSTTASPHHHHSTPAPLLPPPPLPPVGSLNNQTPDNQIFSPATTNENGDNGVHPSSVYFGMPSYYNNCDVGINGQMNIGTTTNTAEMSSMEMPQPLPNLQQLYYFQQQQHEDHQETLASNLNTPIASPQHQSSTLA
ncbi:hypothetical protein C5167_011567 [Papaver somniferum]|uniref:Protein BZR1 homolog n=1 Tax=Papaver somniferum TaxID=3469 RepID=A0A4Y7K4N7_PAPSO|nr:BES1/BZR1 homolog protein 2-like [Papaver somniferum]RZC67877.1 hypothetical protein C5167_011567 [Papaver somniferum]